MKHSIYLHSGIDIHAGIWDDGYMVIHCGLPLDGITIMNDKTNIPYVLEGEAVTRSTTISDSVVTRHHVTAHDTGKVALTWSFDFANVSDDAILELASRAVLIGSRPTFKKCAMSTIGDWVNKTFKVEDFLSRERSKVAPQEKIKSMFAGLTDEDKADLLASLKG